VSPIEYRVTQMVLSAGWLPSAQRREVPDVGFSIRNVGDTYPVRVRVVVTLSQNDRSLGSPQTAGHYDGRFLWNLNPQSGVNGHFSLPATVDLSAPVAAKVNLTVVDLYEREHPLLPTGYVFAPGLDEWYFEPAEAALGPIHSSPTNG
jgi:hypothetical protein